MAKENYGKDITPQIKSRVTGKETYVDKETGEVLYSVEQRLNYVVGTEHEFFFMFVHTLPDFIKLNNAAKNVLAMLLSKFSRVDDFEIGGATRGILAESLGCSKSTVANALTDLRDNRFLIQLRRGYYKINPLYVYQGSLKNRTIELKYLLSLGYSLFGDKSNLVKQVTNLPSNTNFENE